MFRYHTNTAAVTEIHQFCTERIQGNIHRFVFLFPPDNTVAVSPTGTPTLLFPFYSTLDDSDILCPAILRPFLCSFTVYPKSTRLCRDKYNKQDGIHPGVLKNCAPGLAPVLVLLFPFLLETCTGSAQRYITIILLSFYGFHFYYLKSLILLYVRLFPNTFNLAVSSLITSMASGK